MIIYVNVYVAILNVTEWLNLLWLIYFTRFSCFGNAPQLVLWLCSVVAFAPGLWMKGKACEPGMPGKMVAGPNPFGNVVGSAKQKKWQIPSVMFNDVALIIHCLTFVQVADGSYDMIYIYIYICIYIYHMILYDFVCSLHQSKMCLFFGFTSFITWLLCCGTHAGPTSKVANTCSEWSDIFIWMDNDAHGTRLQFILIS